MTIVVLDDDPTGSQTVYGCELLLDWEYSTLLSAIEYSSSLIFILANTRSLTPFLAEKRIKEICRSLSNLIKEENLSQDDFLIITRGDSTLRGHGYLEPNVINQELGPFDATFHAPAFLEGGRTTLNGIHYLNNCPVHKTQFAKDKIFGFSNSNLADWLEEKSDGRLKASSVNNVKIEDLNNAIDSTSGFEKLVNHLSRLNSNQHVIIDSNESNHFMIFVKAIKQLKNKRFLFRSAASLINAFAELPPNPKGVKELSGMRLKDQYSDWKPGLVVIGSHVPLADNQLKLLLEDDLCRGIELPVQEIIKAIQSYASNQLILKLETDLIEKLKKVLTDNKTPVFYTSRGEHCFDSVSKRMEVGLKISEIMAHIVGGIAPNLGYIICKGGITTNALIQKGLNLKKVYLQGQILPGLSLVCSSDKKLFYQMPIITFPGNLGDETTLFKAWRIMESSGQ